MTKSIRVLTVFVFAFILTSCANNPNQNRYSSQNTANNINNYHAVPQANPVLDGLLQKANQGDVTAQNKLGVMYADGKGVAKNATEAEKWFRLAANQGDAAAQTNLGAMEESKQNNTEAMSWYSKSAKQGYALGQTNLAKMYLDKKNYTEAAKWFRKSADQGYADAQIMLGGMYFEGHGVKKDYVTAYKFFSLAAAKGNKKAEEAMVLLQNKMTKSQLEIVCDLKENALVTIFSSRNMGPTPCNMLAIEKDVHKVVDETVEKEKRKH